MATQSSHATDLRGNYDSKELLDYVLKIVIQEPPEFKKIREESAQKGLPAWSVGPLEGKILEFLARSCNAKKAVEVGTLGGYSAAWIAKGLAKDGRLYTLEVNADYAGVAQENLKMAGMAHKTVILVGEAAKALEKLTVQGPFDFCFIDADKVNYPLYLEWAIKNLRPGGLVAGDNAYLFGQLHLDPKQADPEEAPKIKPMREFLNLLANPKYFSSWAMIPTGEGMAVGIRK
ncbi:MAG: O-methyltransferase [Elusimicrobia bacterium]|nr:O-methyltransferase [Elusimicrobiota bacterium]